MGTDKKEEPGKTGPAPKAKKEKTHLKNLGLVTGNQEEVAFAQMFKTCVKKGLIVLK